MEQIQIIGWSSIPAILVGAFLFYWQERVKGKVVEKINESNVRFSHAYSIRTVAMRELYKKLVQTESVLKKFITPELFVWQK